MKKQTELTLELGSLKTRPVLRRSADSAMRILILGDFSGKEKADAHLTLSGQSIMQVDVDNFDDVMSIIKPELHLRSGGSSASNIHLKFRCLDDFHPDAVLQKTAMFQEYQQIRKQLMDPASFEQGVRQLQRQLKIVADNHSKSINTFSNTAPEEDSETLERLLGKHSQQPVQTAKTDPDRVSAYITELISEHIVPEAPPYKDLYIQAIDDAISVQLRDILHHPEFQTLEAAWRCLYMLVSGLETDETLSLHLLDISKQAVIADLDCAGEDLCSAKLYHLLVEQTVNTFGGEPWSLLIGNYSFIPDNTNFTLLGKIGMLASHAGGPFLAAADPLFLGCNSLFEAPEPHDWTGIDQEFASHWQALRSNPVSQWIGLALPRVLMRLPYGSHSDPIDSYDFEELPDQQHEAFLWGNPAFHCALLLAKSFISNGWAMQAGDDLLLEEQPAYIIRQQDKSELQACAEVFLSDRAMEKILCQGFMPFISHRNSNMVRLARFQSIAEPLKALSGAWQ